MIPFMRLGLKNLCQVPWKSDNLGDLKCFLKVFDKFKMVENQRWRK